jgi:RHS repeat-associated protein
VQDIKITKLQIYASNLNDMKNIKFENQNAFVVLILTTLLFISLSSSIKAREVLINSILQSNSANGYPANPCCTNCRVIFTDNNYNYLNAPGCSSFSPDPSYVYAHSILPAPSGNNFVYRNTRNIITLAIDHSKDTILPATFDISVNIRIEAKSTWGGTLETFYTTLNLNNNVTASDAKSQDKVSYVLSHYVDVKVYVEAMTISPANAATTLPEAFMITNQIYTDKFYNVNSVSILEIQNLTSTYTAVDGMLTIAANAVDEAEAYQVEWTWVDDYDPSGNITTDKPTSLINCDFKHNSSRVLINSVTPSYSIPLVYDKGYLIYRIRAVAKNPFNGQYKKDIYGPWSILDDNAALNSLQLVQHYYKIIQNEAHDPNKNWQITQSYAEEGKKIDELNYFDGGNKKRQFLSKDYEFNSLIASEVGYDYIGRPAVNFMPSPVVDDNNITAYRFIPDLNMVEHPVTNQSVVFDQTIYESNITNPADLCGISGLPLDKNTSTGAAKYFSVLNTNGDPYIPNAFGFVYSQSKYTNDKTGRIAISGGIGEKFALGANHETKTFYYSPTQLELDRLFGSEVGDESHYKKIATIDPNGQTSIAYKDMADKVIATCLTGSTASENNTALLADLGPPSVETLTVDLFNKDLNGNSLLNKAIPLADGYEFSKKIFVSENSSYELDYDVEINDLTLDCLAPQNICLGCVYNLTIEIRDDCGELIVPATSTPEIIGNFSLVGNNMVFPTDCNEFTNNVYFRKLPSATSTPTQSIASTPILLTAGLYTISKKLTINEAARDFYIQTLIDSTSGCVLPFSDFLDAAMGDLDFSSCHITCEKCLENLGTKNEFIANGGTEFEFDALYEKCMAPCKPLDMCETLYDQMVMDVTIGGQYGAFDAATIAIHGSQLSVYNVINLLPKNINGSIPSLGPLIPNNTANFHFPKILLNGNYYPYYLDEDGNRVKVFLAGNGYTLVNSGLVYTEAGTGLSYTYPENLQNLVDFVANWKPNFAKSLVYYHPEYCYYEGCIKMNGPSANNATITGHGFDQAMMKMEFYNDQTLGTPNDFLINFPSLPTYFIYNNSGQPFDPFIANASSLIFPNQYNQNINPTFLMQVEMQNYMNTGSTIYEFAAQTVADKHNDTDPLNLSFGYGAYKNEQWNTFKHLYISAKQGVFRKILEFYALYNCAGYNGCIGNNNFTVFEQPMWDYSLVMGNQNSWPYSSFLNTSINPMDDMPIGDPNQPCSCGSYQFYANKIKRFVIPEDSPVNPATFEYQLYQTTGLCPSALDLQHFINGFFNDHPTTFPPSNNSVDISIYNAFTNRLKNRIVGFDNGISTTATFTSNNNDNLSIDIVNGSVNCSISLDDAASTGIWSNLTNLINIIAISDVAAAGNDFTFKLKFVFSNGTTYDTISVNGTTCINILNCSFPPICNNTPVANDLAALINAIALNGDLLNQTNIFGAAGSYFTSNINAYLNVSTAGNQNLYMWTPDPLNEQFLIEEFPGMGLFKIWMGFTNGSDNFDVSLNGGHLGLIQGFYDFSGNEDGTFTVKANVPSYSPGVVTLTGKFKYVNPLNLSEEIIPLAECELPQEIDCNLTENKNFDALEAYINDLLILPLSNQIFNPAFNPNLPSLNGNLQAVFGTPITSSQVISVSQSSDNLQEITIKLNDCDIDLTLTKWPGHSNLGFWDNSITLLSFEQYGTPDFSENFYSFKAAVSFSNGEIDTIIGTSCVPLRDCHPCVEAPQGPANKIAAKSTPQTLYLTEAITAYKEYKNIVSSINKAQKFNEKDPRYIHTSSFEQFFNRDEVLSVNDYIAYLKKITEAGTTNNYLTLEKFHHSLFESNKESASTSFSQTQKLAGGSNSTLGEGVAGIGSAPEVGDTSDCKKMRLYIIEAINTYNSLNTGYQIALQPFNNYNDFKVYCECAYDYFQYIKALLIQYQSTHIAVAPVTIADFCDKKNDCKKKYMTLLAAIDDYNALNTGFSITLAQEINNFAQFLPYCSCVEDYLEYIAYLTDEFTNNNNAIQPIRFLRHCKLEPADPCAILYNNYYNLTVSYNSWVLDNFDGYYPYLDALDETTFILKFCHCYPNYEVLITDLINQQDTIYTPAQISYMINIGNACPSSPCSPLTTDPYAVSPPYLPEVDPCEEMLAGIAFQTAAINYENYLNSIIDSLIAIYNNHCMQSVHENFTMRYPLRETQYTLYYYDAAGNLIKTVPPEGVLPLDINETTDQLAVQCQQDRQNNTQTVFTDHGLASTYVYNSLNQLTQQYTPDCDSVKEMDYTLPNGLPTNEYVNDFQYTGANNAYMFANSDYGNGMSSYTTKYGKVLRSSDNGKNWLLTTGDLVAANMNAIEQLPNGNLMAAGDGGTFLTSTNSGSTWRFLSSPSTFNYSNLTEMLFTSNSVGYIGAENGLFITTNGGSTFTSYLTSPSTSITGIAIKDASTILVTALQNNETKVFEFPVANPAAYTEISAFTANNLNKVVYKDATTAYASGEDGTILKLNANNKWELLKTGTAGNILDVYFSNADMGVVIIDENNTGTGFIHKTLDGGVNWTPINNYPCSRFEIVDRSTNVLIAYGPGGVTQKIVFGLTNVNAVIKGISTGQFSVGIDIEFASGFNYVDANSNPKTFVMVGDNSGVVYFTDSYELSSPVWSSGYIGGFTSAGIKSLWIGKTAAQGNALLGLINDNDNKLFYFSKADATNSISITNTASLANDVQQLASIETDATNNNNVRLLCSSNNTNFDVKSLNLTSTPTINSTPIYSYTASAVQNLKSLAYFAATSGAPLLAVGEDGGIFKLASSSSDESKKVVPHSANAIAYFDVANADFELMAGNDGSIWKYDNVANNGFKLINTATAKNLTTVEVSGNAGTGAIAGTDDGHVLYSDFNNNALNLTSLYHSANNAVTSVKTKTNGGTLYSFASLTNGNVVKITNNNANIAIPPVESTGPSIMAVNDIAIDINSNTGAPLLFGVGNKNTMSSFTPMGTDYLQILYSNNIYFPEIKSLHFSSNSNGVVLSALNIMRYTIDGGNSWQLISPSGLNGSTSYSFNKIVSLNNHQSIVIGAANSIGFVGLIEHSTGVITAYSNSNTSSFTAIAVNGNNGFIGSANGRYFPLAIASNSLSIGTSFVNGVSNGSAIKRIRNFGNRYIAAGNSRIDIVSGFTANAIHGAISNNFNDMVLLADNKTIYAVAEQGNLYQATIDGGTNTLGSAWSNVPLYDPFNVITSGGSSNVTQFNIFTIGAKSSDHIFIGGKKVTGNFYTTTYSMIVHNNNRKFTSRFWYDKLGRMILSQSSKQFSNDINANSSKQYSYTLYDAQSRIVEVGQKDENINSPKLFHTIFGSNVGTSFNAQAIDNVKLDLWMNENGARTEVTSTYYDEEAIDPNISGYQSGYPTIIQKNLRGRVACVSIKENLATQSGVNQYNHATLYSYDIHGNVEKLYQHNPQLTAMMGNSLNAIKTFAYQYDLISGKVNQMDYQYGYEDALSHHYLYDKQNRLTRAMSSTFPMPRYYASQQDPLWNTDAEYEYYKHGPLKRTQLCQNKVQGIDYVYTLQGWIKSVNSTLLNSDTDPGSDGDDQTFTKDAFGYSLGYYHDDYSAIGSTAPFMGVSNTTSNYYLAQSNLYNGNITHMSTSIVDPANPGVALPNAMVYQYDQLNRLKGAHAYQNFNITTYNGWESSGSISNSYENNFTYDLNGNILTQDRKDMAGNAVDNMTYHYAKANSRLYKNRLYQVNDDTDAGSIDDFVYDNSTHPFTPGAAINTDNCYSYDGNGNLIKDKEAGIIRIDWTVSGKIKNIIFDPSLNPVKHNLHFEYDAMGNRVSKQVIDANDDLVSAGFYARDAQGNELAHYDYKEAAPQQMALYCSERNLFGSSRVGQIESTEAMSNHVPYWLDQQQQNTPQYIIHENVLGAKRYELSNHLGNVLAVVTDYKTPVTNGVNPNLAVSYLPYLLSAQDYYPFGWKIPGRSFSSEGYRYGFNGKENDKESATQDYGFRIYNPSIGKFLSVDPLTMNYPWYTPYQFAGNKPIWAIDLDGLEEVLINTYTLGGIPFLKVYSYVRTEFRATGHTTNNNEYVELMRNRDFDLSDLNARAAFRSDWLPEQVKSINDLPANSSNRSDAETIRNNRGRKVICKSTFEKIVNVQFNVNLDTQNDLANSMSQQDIQKLELIAVAMVKFDGITAEIQGSASSSGNYEANSRLAANRANAMKQQIISTLDRIGVSVEEKQSVLNRISVTTNVAEGANNAADQSSKITINGNLNQCIQDYVEGQ